jgi:hypothetical protein
MREHVGGEGEEIFSAIIKINELTLFFANNTQKACSPLRTILKKHTQTIKKHTQTIKNYSAHLMIRCERFLAERTAIQNGW